MRGSLPPLCGGLPQNGSLTNLGAVGVRSAGGTPRAELHIEVIKSSSQFAAFVLLWLCASFASAQSLATRCSPLSSNDNLGSRIQAEVVPFPPYHAAGNDVPTTLRLKHEDGSPAALDDLHVTDAADVDVLVVDESLSDFHYQHLTTTDTPGEYRFVLRSKYGGRYFVWAGVGTTPVGEKRLQKAAVSVAGRSKAFEEVTEWNDTTDEYHFHLSVADGTALIAGQAVRLNLTVTSPTGEPIALSSMARGLGSLSAFSADLESARLMFPADDSLPDNSSQAAEQVTFVFTPPKAGFWKLFGEVKPGGFPRIASFGVNVGEAWSCNGCAEACHCAEACSKITA